MLDWDVVNKKLLVTYFQGGFSVVRKPASEPCWCAICERGEAERRHHQTDPVGWKDTQDAVLQEASDILRRFVAARDKEAAENEETRYRKVSADPATAAEPKDGVPSQASKGEGVRPDYDRCKKKRKKPMLLSRKLKSRSILNADGSQGIKRACPSGLTRPCASA
ncbi:MAG: hypothetical protein ABI231_00440, partial [Candidatus Tumulicola sp.]